MGPVHAVSGFEVPRFRVRVCVWRESHRWYSVECGRVELLCVMGCAEVHGLPAHVKRVGGFRLMMSTANNYVI